MSKTKTSLTGQQLLELGESLGPFVEFLVTKGKSLLAYDVGLLRTTILPQISSALDVKSGLVKKYGERSGNSVTIPFGTDNYEKYQEEIRPLMDRVFEVEIRTIPVDSGLLIGLPGMVFLGVMPILDIQQ